MACSDDKLANRMTATHVFGSQSMSYLDVTDGSPSSANGFIHVEMLQVDDVVRNGYCCHHGAPFERTVYRAVSVASLWQASDCTDIKRFSSETNIISTEPYCHSLIID